jgi:predicted TPR repeat methyltransferase
MSADAIRALYGRSYFEGDEYSDYLADRVAIEKTFARRSATLQRFLDRRIHRRLLEIGSAYGLFLNLVRSWFDTVEGIDVTDAGVAFAHDELGLDVWLGDLLSVDFGGRAYDVVCCWDTIEHLAQPAKYIEKIAGMMTAGGVLALTTGDVGSLNAHLRGSRWRLIHPPTHLHYFSIATMSRLLDRHGFDVVHTEHCGAFRSIGNMAHNILALRWGLDRLGERVRRSAFGALHLYLNLFDIMYVIARKR